MSWLKRLKSGLGKSSSKIVEGVGAIVSKRKLDDATLEELEELLITTDIGVQSSAELTAALAKEKFDKEIAPEEVRRFLAAKIAGILAPVAKELEVSKGSPHVILVVGVNGNGKTTTIGKLAHKYSAEGKKTMLAACDTFRAAAVEQLAIWAERTGCTIVTGKPEADPASVAFAAMEQARQAGADILIIDTAGRLQNKEGLMEELVKISRVLKNLDENAPHDTLLVLDATTGQNAHSQAEIFHEKAGITGLMVTKLDGTAKGGVVVALAKRFGLPIYAIGVGEGVEDLQSFNPEDFANSLMGIG